MRASPPSSPPSKMGGLWATLSEFISPRSPADYRYQTLLPVEGSSSSGTDSRDRVRIASGRYCGGANPCYLQQDYSAGNAYGASPTHRRRTSGSVIPLEVFRSERSSPSLGGGTTQVSSSGGRHSARRRGEELTGDLPGRAGASNQARLVPSSWSGRPPAPGQLFLRRETPRQLCIGDDAPGGASGRPRLARPSFPCRRRSLL